MIPDLSFITVQKNDDLHTTLTRIEKGLHDKPWDNLDPTVICLHESGCISTFNAVDCETLEEQAFNMPHIAAQLDNSPQWMHILIAEGWNVNKGDEIEGINPGDNPKGYETRFVVGISHYPKKEIAWLQRRRGYLPEFIPPDPDSDIVRILSLCHFSAWPPSYNQIITKLEDLIEMIREQHATDPGNGATGDSGNGGD